MSSYYTLDVPEITKQRKGNDKQPFPHQQESFVALSKTLPTPISGYKGTLLVLPTGGGKTFTSVNWICRNILSNGIKVLWLAQSSYLIEQAADCFKGEIHNTIGRNQVNLRVVSSSSTHSNSGSILTTDDILVCTTQTAISAYSSEQLDGRGEPVRTPFGKFIDNCKGQELFIVVDEAHHAPAHGCRTLLLSIREEIQNLYILGLTATPMHMDKRISGWLWKIFDKNICYEADKSILQEHKVLSVPKYIEKDTRIEFEVDDSLYDRLMYKHKDLPENIIEYLARNQSRNNFIIDDYLRNKDEYGKTLIFADRWFQCEYLLDKLRDHGIKADAVYSSVIAGQDKESRDGSGRRNDEDNQKAIKEFRENTLDVLVNVKMLTEGIDFPDVKTVMITRQTTSNILLTQMIGRALRGEQAGGGVGKDYANIVFFHDSWKCLLPLPWANIDGDTDEAKPVKQSRNVMSLVSIQLIKLATADIPFVGFENMPYQTFIPVGFLSCEYTVAIEDSQEMISFAESVIVYEFSKGNYDSFLNHISSQDLTQYASENLPDNALEDISKKCASQFFDVKKDSFDGLLIENISKIIRHVAQNGSKPVFVNFRDRDLYDMDKLVDDFDLLKISPWDVDIQLTKKFDDDKLWQFLYKDYKNFKDAYNKSQERVFSKRREQPAPPEIKAVDTKVELTNDIKKIKKQVFVRDNSTCLCCGKKKRRGVILNADHILPVAMGGKNEISNLQTLCRYCNSDKVKGLNEIDYRATQSSLRKPKDTLTLFDRVKSDSDSNAIARVVNEFYHCRAQCALNECGSGKSSPEWEIVLFAGNDPEWLTPHARQLLKYISNFGWQQHISKIIVRSLANGKIPNFEINRKD